MHHHSATLTTFGIEKLHLKFSQLKDRYDGITQDLKDKTQSHSILAIKSIEKEIIFSDMIKMKTILSNAKVLEQTTNPERAEQGTKVIYFQHDTGIEHKITLVDPLEADPLEGFVSIKSPVGSALLNHRVNDTVMITTPKSNLQLTIVNLE